MSRVRTIVAEGSGVAKSYTYNPVHLDGWDGKKCKTTYYTYSNSYVPLVNTKTMVDEVTPDYKKRMLNGEIINNPMSISHIVQVDEMGQRSCENYYTDSHGCKYGGWRQFYAEPTSKLCLSNPGGTAWRAPVPSIDIGAIKDIVLTNVFSKVGSAEASLYATIGELEESVEGVVQVLVGTAKFLKNVRQKKWYKLKEFLKPKEIASRWMEVRYGLRPLVFEMEQYLSAFRSLSKRGFARLTYRSSKKTSGTSSRNYDVIRGANEWKFKWLATCHRDVSVRAGCIADVEITIATLLGLDRPISAMYELVTLSFVLDWFFNVGKVISSLEPKAGVNILGSWVIVDDVITHTLTATGCDLLLACSGSGSISGRMYSYERSFTRVPNPSKPILPHFDLRLNALKSIDLGIILGQIGSSIFRMG